MYIAEGGREEEGGGREGGREGEGEEELIISHLTPSLLSETSPNCFQLLFQFCCPSLQTHTLQYVCMCMYMCLEVVLFSSFFLFFLSYVCC